MIIARDFLDHWKTRRLVSLRSGDQSAPLILIHLWGFCQLRKKWKFSNLSDDDLDDICHARNVKPHLIAAKFLHEENGVLIVHEWEKYNRKLVSCWKNGNKGGRPIKITRKPNDNPIITQAKPNETHLVLSNLISSNQSVLTNSTSTKAKPNTKDEVVQYCLEKGLKEIDGEWFFDSREACGWRIKKKPILDWRAAVRSWKVQKYFPSQNNHETSALFERQQKGKPPPSMPPITGKYVDIT